MAVMQNLSVGINPSSTETYVVYAVPDNVDYVEVYPIQTTNQSSSSDITLTVRWVDYSSRTYVSSTYWGDGTTVRDNFYDFSHFQVAKDVLLPAGASLSVLDNKLILRSKDVLQFKADVGVNGTISVAVKEYYPDGETPKTVSREIVQSAIGTGVPHGAY